MTDKRQLSHSRQDYPENELYPRTYQHDHLKPPHWEEKDFPGGLYSFSETGAEKQDQQNIWQGPQEQWKQT